MPLNRFLRLAAAPEGVASPAGPLGRLLQRSSAWEALSLPIPGATRWLAWSGALGAITGVLWLTVGVAQLSGSGYLETPVVGPVTSACLLLEWRKPVLVGLALLALLIAGGALITEGFRLAGPRLQRVVFVLGALGVVAAAPPAVSLLALVLLVALYAALVVLGLVLVVVVLGAALDS